MSWKLKLLLLVVASAAVWPLIPATAGAGAGKGNSLTQEEIATILLIATYERQHFPRPDNGPLIILPPAPPKGSSPPSPEQGPGPGPQGL